jgi:dTDP-L-rhamnose 4-epimerase
MRVLITGGAGFIGSHLADRFIEQGWQVRILDSLQRRVHPRGAPQYLPSQADFIQGDVTNARDWEVALEGVDVVSHQAAYQDYFPDYSHFMSANVAGTALLFEVIAARKFPIRKVVVASSQAVYGEGQYDCPDHNLVLSMGRKLPDLNKGDWEVHCPACEKTTRPRLLEEAYPNPLSPYGVSKYCQEMTALRLARLQGIPCVALRYSITQGPRQSLFNQYSGIARIFTLCLMRGEPLVIFEDGLLQRDYVHVEDVVEANWVVTHDDRANGEAFNVGSGVPTTVLQYARRLARRLGKNLEPKPSGMYRLGDARHSVSSIEKLKKLGWQPRRTLDDIINDFVNWVIGLGDLERYVTDAHQRLLELGVLRQAYER